LLVLAACQSKARIFRAGCDADDADACEVVAARLLLGEDGPHDEAGAAVYGKRAHDLRLKACAAGNQDACQKLAARGVVVPMPLDLPKPPPGAEAVQLVLNVDLYADGALVVDDARLASEDALLARAREVLMKSPDLRAVIRADGSVTHGRVIRVLDVLKQAGISKIAFGVSKAEPVTAGSAKP
jgi:biopolymer transport protein ExbD